MQKTVTIKTKWSNLAESVDITDNIKLYATSKAKNSVPVDVTDKFTVTGNEDGTYSLGFKDFASMEELNLSDKYTVTAEGISVNSLLVANTKAVKVNVTSTKAKVVQNVKNINLYRNDIYSQGEIKLSLADKEMAKIAFVRIADGKYSGYYDLQDLGGGVYAIGYLDDKINPGIKDGSISLEIYLEGNNPIYKKPNAKISVKVKNVKFAK